jgi:hypothetical protein
VQFMALIYGDETTWDSLSEDEQQEIYERFRAAASEARAAGVMVGGAELGSTSGATTVRVRDGQTVVTDGPYAESKEVLGGYFLLDCPSVDEALEWAAKIPSAEWGAVEVRQVHVDEDQEVAA